MKWVIFLSSISVDTYLASLKGKYLLKWPKKSAKSCQSGDLEE